MAAPTRFLDRMATFFTIWLALLVGLSLTDTWLKTADFLVNFMFHYGIGLSLLCFWFCIRRHRKGLAVAFCALMLAVYPSRWLFLAPEPEAAASQRESVAILQYNVNFFSMHAPSSSGIILANNHIQSDLRQLKDAYQPDIILLQEMSPDAEQLANDVLEDYPHRLSGAQPHAFGMVLYSKRPFASEGKVFSYKVTPFNHYSITHFMTPRLGYPFTLVETHSFAPTSNAALEYRNTQLQEIAEVIQSLPETNVLLAGDLNVTPYASAFRRLLHATGMTSNLQGRRFSGTWPSFLPPLLRIPIDHLLVRGRVEVTELTRSTPLGSDHLAVLTRISIGPPNGDK